MDLDNATPVPAGLFRGIIDDRLLWASVLVRVTYRLEGGALRRDDQQTWKVSAPPWECPYGPMDSDEIFRKGGVDLMVFGSAWAPGERPAPRLEVTVEIGRASCRERV